MIQYEVHIGYGGRPNADAIFTELSGYVLGLGMLGFTSFDAKDGLLNTKGRPEFESVKVFRFVLEHWASPSESLPWSVLAFVMHAKVLLEQETVLVTATDVQSQLI